MAAAISRAPQAPRSSSLPHPRIQERADVGPHSVPIPPARIDDVALDWQHRNPGALPPLDILDTPLQLGKPPVLTVRQTIDVKRLGYDYAVSSATVPGNR